MDSLRVRAHLQGPICLPAGYVHLDGILAFAVTIRDQIEPAHFHDELVPIEIPVEKEPDERFRLCSSSLGAWDRHDLQYTNRRFPIAEAQMLLDPAKKRVNLAAGAQKHFRLPRQVGHVREDVLTWYLIGDLREIRELLCLIHYLGKRRGVGLGKVTSWDVEAMGRPWPGFPVLDAEGGPLRHLPEGWDGLQTDRWRLGRLTYPYWLKVDEETIAVPEGL